MLKQNLGCENISYSIGDKTLFNNISLSMGQEKTGLVGSNGVGKTTLIRLLVGDLKPQAGTISVDGKIGYLPQNFVANKETSIAAILGIEQKLLALEKIDSGCATQFDFDIVGDDWQVHERAKNSLSKVNLGHLDLSRIIESLSGGETTRVFFARLLMNDPDFLILDEPTNNLDSQSRLALYDMIKNFDGGILTVSHDRQLLALMDQIIELSPLGLKTYGGNYTDYVEQKSVERVALEQDLVDAQKQLSKAKKTAQQSKERYDRRLSIGKKDGINSCQPKIMLGFFKNNAEKTKSKLEARTDKQLTVVRDKLAIAKSKLEQKVLFDFELEATRVHNTKLVLEIGNLVFAYPGHTPVLSGFNMTLVGPKRVAITGKNGSGKTTLLKLIMGELIPTHGSIKIGVQYCAYLDLFWSRKSRQKS